MMRKIRSIVAGTLFLLAVLLLATQPEILVKSFLGISFGTLISWLGVMMYGIFWFYLLPNKFGSNFYKFISLVKRIFLFLALSWGICSALLAGNWNFSFQNKPFRFELWIIITSVVIALPFLILIALGIQRILCKKKN